MTGTDCNMDYNQSLCLKTLTTGAVCVYRAYNFEGLTSGSQYTIEVISISGERRSKPATMILHTSKTHNKFKTHAAPHICCVCAYVCMCVGGREKKKKRFVLQNECSRK